MTAWNHDMSAAPKGHYEDVVQNIGKNVAMSVRHVPVPIIAAGNGGIVTLSKWLPAEGRWNMFTKAVPPMAWQPWPDHPEAKE